MPSGRLSHMMDAIREIIARSVPPIDLAGKAALTGRKAPAEAMLAAPTKWERIVQRKVGEVMATRIRASRAGWPTVVGRSPAATGEDQAGNGIPTLVASPSTS